MRIQKTSSDSVNKCSNVNFGKVRIISHAKASKNQCFVPQINSQSVNKLIINANAKLAQITSGKWFNAIIRLLFS